MNTKIKNYVDVLFSDIPRSTKAIELKEEMLANLNEYYAEYIEQGSSENQAYTQALSTLGDVDELLSSVLQREPSKETTSANPPNFKSSFNHSLVSSLDAAGSDVHNFDISLVSYALYIVQSDADTVRVEIYSNSPDNAPTVQFMGGTIGVSSPKLMHMFNFHSGYVKILVPKDNHYDCNIRMVSGRIEAYVCGNLDINTVSGGITITGSPKSSHIQSTSGKIEIFGAVNGVKASSVSGKITVKYPSEPKGDIDLHAISGSISLSFPEIDGFRFNYSSVSGRTHLLFSDGDTVLSKRGSYTYKNGGTNIHADTVSGNIKLEKN